MLLIDMIMSYIASASANYYAKFAIAGDFMAETLFS